ncbi:MAG: TOBE domain-containing protein, partial [Spirochaetaceae bacterium]|nr:TOBE domain-containing protein [Spirochaetaceae bacterium]
SFIGHYNILQASDFGAASGQDFGGEHVAIRPEVINVSAAAQGAQDGVIQIKGTVKGSIPHGNILRYTLACGAVQLDADVLFDASRLFGENQDVYLSIPREQVLPLQ